MSAWCDPNAQTFRCSHPISNFFSGPLKCQNAHRNSSTCQTSGREVARLLAAAGIRSPQELKRLGAVAAATRIRSLRPDDPPCRSMLDGLEGAIRGVRWHAIPKAERESLWQEYEARIQREQSGAAVFAEWRRDEKRRA